FPDKVYKVEKVLYGLHQAPRAWYETLSTYLLENGYRRGTIDKTLFIKKDKGDDAQEIPDEFYRGAHIILRITASTPMEPNKALVKDEEAENVNVHLYRSMIRSLMYLTASRPDIMFLVFACARFQVSPKVSHLHVVKRIFRYLKGRPKLGLWYPKYSPFDLEAFSDSDYAGSSLDRKYTTGGYQFLKKRLISWQCKKQTIVANSTTEAEYMLLLDRKVKRTTEISQSSGSIPLITYETVIKEWEDRTERAATTASSLVAERDSGSGPKCQDTILGGAEVKLVSVVRLNLLLPVLVYTARHTLTAVRHKLMLPGITCYCWAKTVNGEHQIQALVDKKKVIITETSIRSDLKLNDAKGIDCLPTATIFAELERMSAKTTAWNEFSSTMASAIIFFLYKQVQGMTRHKEVYVTPSHTKKVFANMKRPGKGFSRRVTPLFPTMMIQASEDMGKDSAAPSDSHSTPIISQPSLSKPQKKSRGNKGKTVVLQSLSLMRLVYLPLLVIYLKVVRIVCNFLNW
ncbi:putative ribonuclease H-like domain-containing protein, partial [Tanacetum coccineum]